MFIKLGKYSSEKIKSLFIFILSKQPQAALNDFTFLLKICTWKKYAQEYFQLKFSVVVKSKLDYAYLFSQIFILFTLNHIKGIKIKTGIAVLSNAYIMSNLHGKIINI